MDMFTPEQIQIALKQIKERYIVTETGCWQWQGSTHKTQPHHHIGTKSVSPTRLLWNLTYPDVDSPRFWSHNCELQRQCINPAHKTKRQPKIREKQNKRRIFAKHDNQCDGIDHVVVERIIQAGTINAIAIGDRICDCERAYIYKYVPDAYSILRISGREAQRLKNIDI